MDYLATPRGGVPELRDTADSIAAAAQILSQLSGPIAIDTERASAFRYDDRAFLLQIRREETSLLIDPEGHRALVRDTLAPVLNEELWVLHAASTDLPCLADLGLHTTTLFDTELAARLAGFERSNLAAVIGEVFGLHLDKKFGDADWSSRPLPHAWLEYAALDVELLLELREELIADLEDQGKLEWAQQEFAYVVDEHLRHQSAAPREGWLRLKGLSHLRSREQFQVAREIYRTRDAEAQKRDIAPSRILPDRAVTAMAAELPNTTRDIKQLRNFRPRNPREVHHWLDVIARARLAPEDTWPSDAALATLNDSAASLVPSRRSFSHDYPEQYAVYKDVRAALDEAAEDLQIKSDDLLRSPALRAAVWATEGPEAERERYPLAATVTSADQLQQLLADNGVRPWQRDIAGPIIAAELGIAS